MNHGVNLSVDSYRCGIHICGDESRKVVSKYMGMNQENGYENDVTVDKYNLHTELETLPTLIAKWRKKYSIAEGILDKLTSDKIGRASCRERV